MMRPRRDEICASWSRGGALVTLRALVLVPADSRALSRVLLLRWSDVRVASGVRARTGRTKCEFAGCCKQMMWKNVI